MAKTKKQKLNLTKLSYFLNGALFIAVLLLTFAVYMALGANEVTVKVAKPKLEVNMGSMQYVITDDKAVKRNDASVNALRQFLEKTGKEDILLGCSSTHYNVVRSNKVETQVLLNYGCDYAHAHMYALKGESGWRLVSPTNEFDDLGVPSCDHVNRNEISTEIAPVCVNGLGKPGGQLQYVSR